MAAIDVRGLSFKYPLCEKAAIEDISFTAAEGETVLVCGEGGSGKSTLLRCLKRELIPNGELSGKVLIAGKDRDTLEPGESACLVGFVGQDCEQQIVTDKVWHELAFGPESIGLDKNTIAVRVAETAAYFGIYDKLSKPTASLSGGEKQLLTLASVMIMQPRVLLLDEPCSQLDPLASRQLAETVARLCREQAVTVMIAEHRFEHILPFADRVMRLEKGRLSFCENRSEALKRAAEDEALLRAMPAPVRIFFGLSGDGECPCDTAGARRFVRETFDNSIRALEKKQKPLSKTKALEIKNVTFRYEREGRDIIDGLDLEVSEGECLTLLGANGSGKSTALGLISGALKAQTGSIRIFGKKIKEYKNNSLYQGTLSMLPQDVTELFTKNSVKEELEDSHITEIPFGLEKLSERHPYDLSGGERQLLALAKVLAREPKILLLDEPTKSLDATSTDRLCEMIRDLKKKGMTVLAVSHDTEFCAEVSDRCAVFFSGRLSEPAATVKVLGENRYFTTASSLITRDRYDGALTVEDTVRICNMNRRL